MLTALLLVACSEHPYPREGRAELDTRDTADTGALVDTGPPPDTEPGPDAGEVCYPGLLRDDSACVRVVEHRDAWGAAYDYPPPYGDSPQYVAPSRYIDLQRTDPDLEVAPNFALDELMQAHKGRYGIFSPHVVSLLQDIRDQIGGPLSINSAYRNVTYNAGVGGVTYSRHQYGDAVDIGSSDASLEDLAALCGAAGASFVSEYTSHVHCDWRDTPLEPAFYDTEARSVARSAPLPSATITRDGGVWTAPSEGFDEGEPARRWVAYDADGTRCGTGAGATFTAPPEAARVEVRVGGWLVLTAPAG